jgi:hypothetical protein
MGLGRPRHLLQPRPMGRLARRLSSTQLLVSPTTCAVQPLPRIRRELALSPTELPPTLPREPASLPSTLALSGKPRLSPRSTWISSTSRAARISPTSRATRISPADHSTGQAGPTRISSTHERNSSARATKHSTGPAWTTSYATDHAAEWYPPSAAPAQSTGHKTANPTDTSDPSCATNPACATAQASKSPSAPAQTTKPSSSAAQTAKSSSKPEQTAAAIQATELWRRSSTRTATRAARRRRQTEHALEARNGQCERVISSNTIVVLAC